MSFQINNAASARLGWSDLLAMAALLDIDVVCAGHQKAMEELACLRKKATQRGAQLQVLREWMRETDWLLFCSDHPEAPKWFDDDGVPVSC